MSDYPKEAFKVLTAAIALFAAMEIYRPGMVIAFFNLDLVLIFWFLNSIILLLLKDKA
jgi:F0F1-type ATP synthase assembly protein I